MSKTLSVLAAAAAILGLSATLATAAPSTHVVVEKDKVTVTASNADASKYVCHIVYTAYYTVLGEDKGDSYDQTADVAPGLKDAVFYTSGASHKDGSTSGVDVSCKPG